MIVTVNLRGFFKKFSLDNMKTYDDMNTLDKTIGYLKKHKKEIYRILIIVLAITFNNTGICFAAGGFTKAINKLSSIGKYIILITTLIDCIQSSLNGDYDGIKEKAMGGLVLYCILLGLPLAFDWVEEVVNDLKK